MINTELRHNLEILRGTVEPDSLVETCFILKMLKDKFCNSKISQVYNEYCNYINKFNLKRTINNENDFINIYYSFLSEFNLEELFLINQRYTGVIAISKSVIVSKYAELLNNKECSVFIPDAENFTEGLTELINKHNNCKFTISSNKILNCEIFKVIFKNYDNVKIINANIYKYNFIESKFDLIFAIPAFSGKISDFESQNFLCREYDLVATENLLLHLSDNGILGIILPAKVTFASGKIEKFRMFVQDMYGINEISEMPTGIFQNISVKTFFFLLSTGKTDDITIKKYTFNKAKDDLLVENETFVMLSELETLDDWNINKIFSSQDEDWQKYKNSNTKKFHLGDVAETFRGKVIPRKDSNGSIGVVNISNLNGYKIDYDNLEHLEENERKINNYVLEEGDVLLPARGTTIKTAVFAKQAYPCIASSNLIVIRPNNKYLYGTYLKIFLDSEIGIKLIKSMQQGTTLVNLSYKDLPNIEIPILPLEEQKVIAEEYEKELSLYKNAINEANDRWQNVVKKLQNKF